MGRLLNFIKRIKKKNYIQMFLVFLLVGVILCVTHEYWLSRNLTVTFKSEAKKDIVYQFFYTCKPNENFNEKHSVKKTVSAKEKLVVMEIPTHRLYRFRLDIGNTPGEVKISRLKIVGNKKQRFDDFNAFSFSKDIEKHHIDGIKLVLSSHKKDPYIVYKKEVIDKNDYLLKGKYVIYDWHILIILTVLSFLGSYKFVQYLAKFKILELRSRIDIVFLAFLAIGLYLPMSHISGADKSTQENRMLAKKPQLFSNNKINTKYGEQFEKWFNDRFLGREKLINFYNCFKSRLTPFSGNNKVLVGKDGWLFYKGDNSLNNFANLSVLEDDDLKNGLQYLKDFQAWCKTNGKEFYYVLAPDKNKIYGEHFRFLNKSKPNEFGIGNQFINYIKTNSDVPALYLYDALIKNKDKGLLYYKNDTHWNEFGAYLAYNEIITMMKEASDKEIQSLKITDWTEAALEKGDLASMYPTIFNKFDYKYPLYKKPLFTKTANCESEKKYKKDNGVIKCANPQKGYRIFILRDSFSINLTPLFAETFGTVHFHWKYSITKEELELIKNKFDIVILENVERYIPKILNLTFPKD